MTVHFPDVSNHQPGANARFSITATTPFTFGSGDSISVTFLAEVA